MTLETDLDTFNLRRFDSLIAISLRLGYTWSTGETLGSPSPCLRLRSSSHPRIAVSHSKLRFPRRSTSFYDASALAYSTVPNQQTLKQHGGKALIEFSGDYTCAAPLQTPWQAGEEKTNLGGRIGNG